MDTFIPWDIPKLCYRMGAIVSTESLKNENQKRRLVEEMRKIYADDPSAWEAVIESVRADISPVQATKESDSSTDVAADAMQGLSISEPTAEDPVVKAGVKGISEALVEELNLLRSNPAAYAVHVEAHLSAFEDDFVYKAGKAGESGGEHLIKTSEGKAAVYEAVGFLKGKTEHHTSVKISKELEKAAIDHQVLIYPPIVPTLMRALPVAYLSVSRSLKRPSHNYASP